MKITRRLALGAFFGGLFTRFRREPTLREVVNDGINPAWDGAIQATMRRFNSEFADYVASPNPLLVRMRNSVDVTMDGGVSVSAPIIYGDSNPWGQ